MADGTKIEWTDATVNAVNGCTVLSPGCKRCYAMRQAHRFEARRGLTQHTAGGMVWTGEVRLNEKALLQPLAWKRPRRIFWNAHGDLFHENVPDAWIDKVFAVCALTPQHQHQILTKRSARMRAYLSDPRMPQRVALVCFDMNRAGLVKFSALFAALGDRERDEDAEFVPIPLANVWLGVSVEDQRRADDRIPDLLATPGAVRFLSVEPLLGPVDLDIFPVFGPSRERLLHWVIVGGESGHGARPMHPAWVRSLRDQCADADVPFFFKQWGEWLPWEPGCPPEWQSQSGLREDHHALFPDDIDADPKWDDGIWAVPDHDHFAFQRVGKKAAGRMLDGATHDGMPA
ncbi:phage Gp37/Gp68 family protein [Sphingomonas hengshuiensis]|uniref:Phage Gp37/Gp68 family protein n=1 Tax=Sphingomonas hengshuiensis TaxID=1609977 RepID=A0A7U4J8R5_9SPHN|nr:phage Gp37/Gp68 family protein [Sphingomonas hengshuiensis]AJP72278.1 hypothetical protein TS85_11505 [Sphingomonas hengshuiensis]